MSSGWWGADGGHWWRVCSRASHNTIIWRRACAEETDWPQILAWYDDLVALTEDPVRQDPAAMLGRAVAVGHVLGHAAGLLETDRLREVLGDRHRWHAVRGHLYELAGDLRAAATAYAEAARRAVNIAERDHLVRQAARARAAER